jgi:hypothetical protein
MPDFARSIVRFLLGDADAIRRLASWSPLLGVGAVLVLTAGIAREYDHEYFASQPQAFLLPLAASFATATLVYGSLRLFVLRGPRSQARGRYRSFLGLFWLTAPLAWIYALPVERVLEPVPAALCNIAFLAVVASWRVWLMSRVAVVLFGATFPRALGAILLPSSLLVMGVGLVVPFRLVPLMGGISLAPETQLLVRAAGFATTGSLLAFVAAGVLLAANPNRPTTPLARPASAAFPALPMLVLLLGWVAVAAAPQLEVRRSDRLDALLAQERYREALDLVSTSEPGDFAPTRRIAPDPQQNGSGSQIHLPRLFEVMDGSEPDWVRALYLDYLAIVLGPGYFLPPLEFLEIYAEKLAQLPEGAEFARAHRDDLERIAAVYLERDAAQGEGSREEGQRLREAYRALGVF